MLRSLLFSLLLAGAATAETVPVSHPRELRGAWVASVAHITFPSKPGLTGEQQREEMTRLLDTLHSSGFNAVFLQVRPEGDALYSSSLEPWSRFVGGDPGYDPLEWTIEQAHARNLEVHAWLNPYRARGLPRTVEPFQAPHLGALLPEHVHRYGQFFWMDPGAPAVRERLVDVVRDLVARYDVDGIHFDDYFYPYPEGDQDFPDDWTWFSYQNAGGNLSRADWRRENVNRAIREVSQAVRSERDSVRFGISPFGIPAPEKPAGIQGMDQYVKLYADTQKWMDEGWVDYLAPQLYWPTTQAPQAFEPLLRWWVQHARDGRYIFPGINLAALHSKPAWTVAELREQIRLTRAAGAAGTICWNVNPLLENRPGARDLFAEVFSRPALTPPLSDAAGVRPPAPSVRVQDHRVSWEAADDTPLRAWTLYQRVGPAWRLAQVVPARADGVELPPGAWAVAAVSRYGTESDGTVVRVVEQQIQAGR
jgi:uncharacterized lipoprotein YddW (UPF0748 family)